MKILSKFFKCDDSDAPFFNNSDTMRFCGNISRTTLWRWRKKGLRSYKVGNHRLYRASDIVDFITKHSK